MSKSYDNIMVLLDSNHTKQHVLEELEAYANLFSVGSYCIVYDTVIEDLPNIYPNRDWDRGNSTMNAVYEFLKKTSSNFQIVHDIDRKLQFSVDQKVI